MFPPLPTFLDLFQPDKLVHIFIFGVYFVLQARGFALQDCVQVLRQYPVLYTFMVTLTLGALTEILQEYLVPMRDGNIYDFIADSAGCLVGWWVFVLLRKRLRTDN